MPWTPPAGTAALIFDCDGTLADTMPLHFRAWTRLFARLGVPFPEPRFYALGGMPTAAIIRTLCAEHAVPVPADVQLLVEEKEAFFLQLIDQVQPVPAVFAIYQAARGRLPMAVASGGYRAVVTRTLEAIHASGFGAIVCAEDTPRHKPHPDVFLEAARRLGVAAAACVVFEDTDLGLEAARRAGMKSVDVRPWYTSH